ncbi:exonuclease domain-containing protein [Streptomyces sp. NPDC050617]|uniref:exonuclease domain-containing protein n=1 Tax=Streptomyces sp. NPDC050617 TaxID=3154628 RepID=UPI00344AC519
MSWYRGTLTGFDLETTGTDIEHDRVVTAALVRLEPDGGIAGERTWLLDPGIAIPEEAAAIHGISTERARAHGSPAAPAIAEIADAVAEVLRAGAPLVVMNARYDLSLLDRECRRHGVEPLSERLGSGPWPVVDPLVLDKHADRYRKGKRTLQALCAHYGVPLDGAHHAEADAAAAARTARCVGETYEPVGSMPLADLYGLQVEAAAEQSASLQSYLRRTSNPTAYIEPAWPVIPNGDGRAETGSGSAAIPAQRAGGHPRVS